MSFRNRFVIAGSSGPVQLSIPLQRGRNQKSLITQVEVDNRSPWQAQHWKAILSCYHRAPWFEHYAPGLEEFYRKPYRFLCDWNLDLFKWVIGNLQPDCTIDFTKDYFDIYPPDQVMDWRNKIVPSTYRDFTNKVYYQVFSERVAFLPNLSILDLLFCLGKESPKYLTAR